MITIRELHNKKSGYIRLIAKLHQKEFSNFFLTQLGIPFLKTLYSCYIEDKYSGMIVAEDDGELIGFIAYSNNYPKFYRDLIKHHLVKFAFCSLGAAILHPSFIKRLLGAFKKSKEVEKKERYVELASICVDSRIKGTGVGSRLIDYLKNIVDFNTYEYINLETDADKNEKANNFYIKNGFILERQFTTAEGRKMNEYRFAKGKLYEQK